MSYTNTLRLMAEQYMRLVKRATDPTEKARFIDYASLYAQLGEQASRGRLRETAPDAIRRVRLAASVRLTTTHRFVPFRRRDA